MLLVLMLDVARPYISPQACFGSSASGPRIRRVRNVRADASFPLMQDELDEIDEIASNLGLHAQGPESLPERGVYCTRALDLRDIKAIGYDMDYTLIDYKMELMEERVYSYSKQYLQMKGFPVSGLTFDVELVVRGLAIDIELGNLIKVDRFGFVRRAMHGTKELTQEEIEEAYQMTPPVDLRDSRWVFLNTLFSVSEGWSHARPSKASFLRRRLLSPSVALCDPLSPSVTLLLRLPPSPPLSPRLHLHLHLLSRLCWLSAPLASFPPKRAAFESLLSESLLSESLLRESLLSEQRSSPSAGSLYAQLVDRLDSGELLANCQEPFDASRCSTYDQLYSAVSKALFR